MKYNSEKIYANQKDIVERAKKEGAIVLERNEEADEDHFNSLDIDKIYNEVEKLKTYVDNNKERNLEETKRLYPYIPNNFPTIFNIIYRGDDLGTIYDMLKSIVKIQKGNITFEEETKKLGKKLADKYSKK